MAKSTIRELNGYRLVYEPGHPKCMTSDNWDGYVYEHIYVIEKYRGRAILDSEIVHHLDGNRANNRHQNLLVLDRGEHAKLETWISQGAPNEKLLGANRVNSGKSTASPEYCLACLRTLQDKQRKHCSVECAVSSGNNHNVKQPSAEELFEDMQCMTWTAMGLKYGVSDNAVRKWAKKHDLL